MCLGIACAGSALGLAAAGRWKEMLAAPSPAESSDGSSTDKTLYGEAVSGIVDDVTIGAAAAEAAQTKSEKKRRPVRTSGVKTGGDTFGTRLHPTNTHAPTL
jgi:hypothetical protein